ncbi:MAG: glycosyl hydrolase [Armatimonadota bacterium]
MLNVMHVVLGALALASEGATISGWVPFGGDSALVERDAGLGGAHAAAMKISRLHAAQAGWTSPPQDVRAGHTYLVSVFIRTADLRQAQAEVILEWLSREGDNWVRVGEPYDTGIVATGTYDWLRYNAVVKASEGACAARIICRLRSLHHAPADESYSSGTAWFDQVSIERVPDVRVGSDVPGNVFFAGDPVALRVTLSDADSPEPAELAYTVVDFDGKLLFSGRFGWNPRTDVRMVHTIAVPARGTGYYELQWALKRAGSSVLTGRTSFAIVENPAKRTYREESPLALDAGFSWFYMTPERLETAAKLARAAGLTCLRDRLLWAGTEPAKGRFQWGWYDKTADAQKAAGITVYQVFHDCPDWATSAPPNTRSRHSYPPKDPHDVYLYFREAAAHFRGRVKFWEIWNEPDIFFFAGRPEEYAALLKAAYLGCKDGNPDCEVLFGSLAMQAGTWAERVFENGVSDYFDLFNMHYYGDVNGVLERIRANKSLLERFGCRKPIWLTEMGVPANMGSDGTFAESERHQAEYLVKAYAHALSHGIDRFFFFYMAEFLENAAALWGIVRKDLTPKPAYAALAVLTSVLGEARYVGRVDLGAPNSWGYVFHSGKQDVLIAWADRPQTVEIETSGRLEVLDIMGRSSMVFAKDGRGRVQLTPMPVYVLGLSEGFVKRAKDEAPWPKRGPVRPAVTASRIWTALEFVEPGGKPPVDQVLAERNAFVCRGRSQRVAVRVFNYTDRSIPVQVWLEVPDGWSVEGSNSAAVTVRPMGQERVMFTMVRQGQLSGSEKRVVVYASAEPLEKAIPLSVGYIRAE